VIVDSATFTELATHLRDASAALFEAARCLAMMEGGPSVAARTHTFASLLSVGMQLLALETMLHALLDAERPAADASAPGRDDGVLPHPVA
jgi:hypothetical protein